MKGAKIKIVLLLVLISPLSNTWAGFLISHTPAIEGRITDADTGQPIQYAIVEVQWYREALLAFDASSDTVEMGKPLLAATDQDGKYRIPGRLWGWTPRGVEGFDLWVRHPLYEANRLIPIAMSPNTYKEFRQKYRQDHRFIYNSSLKTLNQSSHRLWTSIDTHEGMRGAPIDDLEYFRAAKKLRIPFKNTITDWDTFSQTKEMRAIFEALENDN